MEAPRAGGKLKPSLVRAYQCTQLMEAIAKDSLTVLVRAVGTFQRALSLRDKQSVNITYSNACNLAMSILRLDE